MSRVRPALVQWVARGSPPVNRHHARQKVRPSEQGAAMVEYVLLFSLIVLVCLASVTVFGEGISTSVNDSSSRVVNATP